MAGADAEALVEPRSAICAARFIRVGADGATTEIVRDLADEVPIAIEYQGIGYAVLMATPQDLEDLAFGFTLAERLVDHGGQIEEVLLHPTAYGIIVRVTLAAAVAERVVDRVRHRTTESSCGMCGIENLEQALRPLPRLTAATRAADVACFQALADLEAFQDLNRRTGAVHAAAACAPDGRILLVREDVGRHNAFDKLVGAMARAGQGWDGGFALVSSRCSYELVEKAVLTNCPMLAAISAPTALAIERAAAAGLRLRTLVRRDALLAIDP
ncbi:formate dehydrogenase accessory sulfurtransferase FdhD [Sphingomonas sp.]|uniref:formate dehydrogenase accessory sulfurtransferase FdhD n=1 Tax=Sphingomonas sp. TaxID=28214 RepID=UPI000DB09BFB|nr:formate dehydrogenase accessory sulfurtransferase FdhD [Sphingomonas sp.]PZU07241.1 MAG: formate dehydrogenase accessory sulfurtransferase FdhD [Sphingomonas sp.]